MALAKSGDVIFSVPLVSGDASGKCTLEFTYDIFGSTFSFPLVEHETLTVAQLKLRIARQAQLFAEDEAKTLTEEQAMAKDGAGVRIFPTTAEKADGLNERVVPLIATPGVNRVAGFILPRVFPPKTEKINSATAFQLLQAVLPSEK